LLAERAGVSKTAPYRHFKDKDVFLGALADEGFRLLYSQLEQVSRTSKQSSKPTSKRATKTKTRIATEAEPTVASETTAVAAMGKAYMDFAVAHPALYRLMNSSLVCTLPSELTQWARRSLLLLARSLKPAVVDGKTGVDLTDEKNAADTAVGVPEGAAKGDSVIDIDATVAAWAYIHGLVSIRIDGLFPADLPEPQWDKLAGMIPSEPHTAFSGKQA
jgi:AcrR family transcriptional regulator